ncbi:hypothetical protein ACFWM5_27020 [Streptomyces bobili]|uniref:hypothetical protein n=1 Tax=Streptomyces bobili TaxID=67280 RepID=UPI00364C291C
MQARSAVMDFSGADRHAAAVDGLGRRYELPLAGLFTHWHRALRVAETGTFEKAEAACRAAAAGLDGAGMPGLERGLLPLTLFCLRMRHGEPYGSDPDADWGPHEPWVTPLRLLEDGRHTEAGKLLRKLPEPPRVCCRRLFGT